MIAANATTSNIHSTMFTNEPGINGIEFLIEVGDMVIDVRPYRNGGFRGTVHIEDECIADERGCTALQAMNRAYRAAQAYRAAFC